MPNLERFLASMSVDYEAWREGASYDLEALRAAEPDELSRIEAMLVQGELHDWRQVEALAAIGSDRCRDKLREAIWSSRAVVRQAVLRFAPDVVTWPERTRIVVRGLEEAEHMEGLSEALEEAARHHPPAVVETAWRCLETRDASVAAGFAGLLSYIHGHAETRFDWDQRPYYLQFATNDMARRAELVAALRRRLTGS